MGKGIEELLERVKAMRGGRVRVTLKDGSIVTGPPAVAIPLWKDDLAVKIEPVGDMSGSGLLWELLAGLVEKENNQNSGGSDHE